MIILAAFFVPDRKFVGLRQPVDDRFIATYADLACYRSLNQPWLVERLVRHVSGRPAILQIFSCSTLQEFLFELSAPSRLVF